MMKTLKVATAVVAIAFVLSVASTSEAVIVAAEDLGKELEQKFKDRLWRIRRDLRQTGEALVETQRSRRQVDESMRRQPVEFEEFSRRVYGLQPRVEGMRMRVSDAMAEQRAFLQAIAVGELQAQKDRLDVYTIQARFALAAIYDRAATVGEVDVE